MLEASKLSKRQATEGCGRSEKGADRAKHPTRSVNRAPRRLSNAKHKMADKDIVFFPRKLLRKFIQLYKDQPCLWDRNCPAYKLKMKRYDAISKLTTLVQEYDRTATRVHVLRKIESLRACVRREYKRVRDSRQQATSEDEVYTPHLWYYELLCFIFPDEVESKTKEVAGSPEPNAASEDPESEDDDDGGQSFDQGADSYPEPISIVHVLDNSPLNNKYSTYTERHCTEVDDEYDAIGINVAAKLRALPTNMRILAEKLINDVLYQAQSDALNSSTVITNADPFKQDPL